MLTEGPESLEQKNTHFAQAGRHSPFTFRSKVLPAALSWVFSYSAFSTH